MGNSGQKRDCGKRCHARIVQGFIGQVRASIKKGHSPRRCPATSADCRAEGHRRAAHRRILRRGDCCRGGNHCGRARHPHGKRDIIVIDLAGSVLAQPDLQCPGREAGRRRGVADCPRQKSAQAGMGQVGVLRDKRIAGPKLDIILISRLQSSSIATIADGPGQRIGLVGCQRIR